MNSPSTLNRAERRAIEYGRGRNEPFVEVEDYVTMCSYYFGMAFLFYHPQESYPFENAKRLFIECQIDPFDWRDDCLDIY